jgi:hypothetical protein
MEEFQMKEQRTEEYYEVTRKDELGNKACGCGCHASVTVVYSKSAGDVSVQSAKERDDVAIKILEVE